MARNHTFTSVKKPYENERLKVDDSRVHGPVRFLNPTTAPYTRKVPGERESTEDDAGTSSARAKDPYTVVWRSRDNRKGRHALQIHDVSPTASQATGDTSAQLPPLTSTTSEIVKVTLRMFTVFRPWDISWLVAQFFVWGSIVWVVNGFFDFLPFVDAGTDFDTETLYAGGITAFIGAIIFFETGSILLMFEAVNENRGDCFGWALEQVIDDVEGEEGKRRSVRVRPASDCAHRWHRKKSDIANVKKEKDGGTDADEGRESDGKKWQWFPSWHDLRVHYFHELGFLACLAQLFGATIFGISGFTALPGIQDHLSPQRVLNGVYWVPQIVGGTGFIVSSMFFMLETQKTWYTPAFGVLGWHIGFWNFVGAVGFTMSGSFGPAYGSHGAQYQAACSTFWGSWAFLIGSVLQLYESLQKHPVEKVKAGT